MRIPIGAACPACGAALTLFTKVDQDPCPTVDKPHDWFCEAGDDVKCNARCGVKLRITIDDDGGAWLETRP